MEFTSIIFVIFLAQSTYGVPTDTTLAPDTTTLQQPEKAQIQTSTETQITIQCLNNSCTDPQDKVVTQKSGKKELDSPSKIIDSHKDKSPNHEVSGRKGVDPSTDVVTEMTNDHVQDLHNLKETTTTTTISTTTTSRRTTTVISEQTVKEEEPVVNDDTPRTSLLVGIILGCTLLCVLIFVGFKRLDAIRRRREYRRMNDFLIDGMYNEM